MIVRVSILSVSTISGVFVFGGQTKAPTKLKLSIIIKG